MGGLGFQTIILVGLCVMVSWKGQIAAWNTDLHCQIGFMAEAFLPVSTSDILGKILATESDYGGSIGRAAAWADEFAHTEEGKYSYPWHWIDSSDDAPQICHINWPTDCAAGHGGCIVSAIANQTRILWGCVRYLKYGQPIPERSVTPCARALKWIVHFIGDITQPLHASGYAEGGNLVNVTFGGVRTNLHAVWDGHILYADAGVSQFSNTSIAPFFKALADRIQFSDDFLEPVTSWVSCVDPTYPATCALSWALESNRWTCEYVYQIDFGGSDLLRSGYAEGAFPIVELQVSKAALRLATWLNRLVLEDFMPLTLDVEARVHVDSYAVEL